MYKIVFELNYYNGPLEGVCCKDSRFFYYHLTQYSDVVSDEPRAYYLYELDGSEGRPLTWQIIVESELVRDV
jgi:hypothetical protein